MLCIAFFLLYSNENSIIDIQEVSARHVDSILKSSFVLIFSWVHQIEWMYALYRNKGWNIFIKLFLHFDLLVAPAAEQSNFSSDCSVWLVGCLFVDRI